MEERTVVLTMSGDSTALYDPSVTLADLELGYSAHIRLTTGGQAITVIGVRTVEAAPDQISVHCDPR